jgi:hypothetical protein
MQVNQINEKHKNKLESLENQLAETEIKLNDKDNNISNVNS